MANYLADYSRLLGDLELEYPEFPARVLEIINEVLRDPWLSPAS